MHIISWEQFLQNGLPLNGKQSSMTAGIFDGVHLGHQSLLKCVVSFNADFVPVVVTFRDNYKIGNRERIKDINDIQSFEERLETFKNMGIKITIAVDFTDEFKHMPGIEFLELLILHGSVGFFAVGSDFCCGYKLDTDAEAIQKFFTSRGISSEIVPEVCYPITARERSGTADVPSGKMGVPLPISSSRIRAAIAAGDYEPAEKMLGYTI